MNTWDISGVIRKLYKRRNGNSRTEKNTVHTVKKLFRSTTDCAPKKKKVKELKVRSINILQSETVNNCNTEQSISEWPIE